MPKIRRIHIIQLAFFLTTFATVTLSGEFWIRGKMWLAGPYEWPDFVEGLKFSLPFLLFLTVHEFGHFFTAVSHKVKTTLPYYIPLPPFFLVGTMGAIIRIKGKIWSKKQYFDIGVSGPIAGFVIAFASLFYGFTHLPAEDYIYDIHPEYAGHGKDYGLEVQSDSTMNLAIGKNILFSVMEEALVEDPSRMPNKYEIIHYPYLFAGFLALFFTALNLLPIGQLDGGHVLYGLFGYKWHFLISRIIFTAFLFYAGYGLFTPQDDMNTLIWAVPYLYFLYVMFRSFKMDRQTTLMYATIMFALQFLMPLVYKGIEGYSGWLLFAFIISRVLGVAHPKAEIEQPLDWKRQLLGWIALIIFVISFSPQPFIME